MDKNDPAVQNFKFPAKFGQFFFQGHYSGPKNRYHMSTPKYFVRDEWLITDVYIYNVKDLPTYNIL